MNLKTVLYENRDGICRITLNRPDSLNALDAALGADLATALRAASADAAARVIVLTGAGRAFCSGGDLKSMAKGLASDSGQTYELSAILRNFHDVVKTLWESPLPVIAAIHGPAVGAGFSIALGCDFRIAAADATFSQAFVRIGLTPDGGSSWLLPRIAGPARAAELTMTGATIDAAKALEWGIVNRMTPAGGDIAAANELAASLAALSHSAMIALKRLLRVSETNSFAQQLDAEAAAQVENAASPEFRAALAAFVRKG